MIVNTTNTSAVNGDFVALQCITDTVFSAFVETFASGQAITGITIPAGTVLFAERDGSIRSYTLTSGVVRATAR
jgi:hypothetical protein